MKMKLYKAIAENLVGKKIDCTRHIKFGDYPIEIKRRADGTLYTKGNKCGVCCDIPEKESDPNCYDFDIVID